MTQLKDNFIKLDYLTTMITSESPSYDSFLEFIALYEECNELLNHAEQDVAAQRQKLESYWGKHSEEKN